MRRVRTDIEFLGLNVKYDLMSSLFRVYLEDHNDSSDLSKANGYLQPSSSL